MQRFEIDRYRRPPIAFTGELLASATGEGSGERWTDLHLYRLPNGRYVAHTVGRSCFPHETDRHNAEKFDTLMAALGWFRPSRVTSELLKTLAAAGIEETPRG